MKDSEHGDFVSLSDWESINAALSTSREECEGLREKLEETKSDVSLLRLAVTQAMVLIEQTYCSDINETPPEHLDETHAAWGMHKRLDLALAATKPEASPTPTEVKT